MTKRILVSSPVGNPHVFKQLDFIKKSFPDVEVDFLSLSYVNDKDVFRLKELVSKCYLLINKDFCDSFIRKILQFYGIICLRKQIMGNYDCIWINAITIKYLLIFSVLRNKTQTLVLSPWGSEVLRAGNLSLRILRLFYSKADKITTVRHSRFEKVIIKSLAIDERKLVDLPNGTKLIDMHIKGTLSKEEAKQKILLGDRFIVTIGYNGYKTQNHIAIIDELYKISNRLPRNTHLVLPLTYGLNDNYMNEIKEKLNKTNFKYTIYTDFMSIEQLYELQRATDVFIHLQKTDASSASVKEFIMGEAVVFNGIWLSYPEIEMHGVPYIEVNDFSDLNNKILEYLSGSLHPHVTKETIKDIKRFSHKESLVNSYNAVSEWII